jgi:hypothetical protein
MIRAVAIAGCAAGWLACSTGTPSPAATADDVIRPYARVHFGDPIAAAREALPGLVASGWQEGTRATWLDPAIEGGLEIETDAERVRAVSVTFGDGRSDVVERELRARLGSGVACSTLPEGISSFQPTLWRTPDGGAVSLVRKQRILQLRVERPATPAFDQAWTSCRS